MLDDLGLIAGIEAMATKLRSSNDLDVRVEVATVDGTGFGRLEPDLETALYRVAQEALNNCCKHANATHIAVSLGRSHDRVILRVADDGRGGDPSSARDAGSGTGLGLLDMRQRLHPWRGTVSFAPNAPLGSVLTAEVVLCGG